MSTAPSQPGSFEFRSGAKGHAINESEASVAGLLAKNAEPTPMVPLPETQPEITVPDGVETAQAPEQVMSFSQEQSQSESVDAPLTAANDQSPAQVPTESAQAAVENTTNTPVSSLKAQEDQFAKQVEVNATGAAMTETGK